MHSEVLDCLETLSIRIRGIINVKLIKITMLNTYYNAI